MSEDLHPSIPEAENLAKAIQMRLVEPSVQRIEARITSVERSITVVKGLLTTALILLILIGTGLGFLIYQF